MKSELDYRLFNDLNFNQYTQEKKQLKRSFSKLDLSESRLKKRPRTN